MGAPEDLGQRADGGRAGAAVSCLGDLLPRGWAPGGVVSTTDLPLLLALAAEAAGPGAGWAVVGLPQLGALAAGHAGLDLASGVWVDSPGARWPQVLGLLVGAVPLVLLGAPRPVAGAVGRRIAAQVRRAGATLLVAGVWTGADARLRVTGTVWEGVGTGHGVLQGRRTVVEATGAVSRWPAGWRCGSRTPRGRPP
jgi:hypothetical protein